MEIIQLDLNPEPTAPLASQRNTVAYFDLRESTVSPGDTARNISVVIAAVKHLRAYEREQQRKFRVGDRVGTEGLFVLPHIVVLADANSWPVQTRTQRIHDIVEAGALFLPWKDEGVPDLSEFFRKRFVLERREGQSRALDGRPGDLAQTRNTHRVKDVGISSPWREGIGPNVADIRESVLDEGPLDIYRNPPYGLPLGAFAALLRTAQSPEVDE